MHTGTDPAAKKWPDRQHAQDILLKPVADILIGRAQARAGERIVDVGCGSGAISIALAATHSIRQALMPLVRGQSVPLAAAIWIVTTNATLAAG